MIGNWVDLSIIFFVFIYCLIGIKQGAVRVTLSFLSFILAFVFAIYTYQISSYFFSLNFQLAEAYANVLGFFINTLLLKLFFMMFFRFILQRTDWFSKIKNSLWDQAIGGFNALLYASLVSFISLSMTVSLSLPSFASRDVDESTCGKLVHRDFLMINDNLSGIFGEVLKTAMGSLNFLTVEKGLSESMELGFEVLEVSVNEELEVQMLEKVNQERLAVNLKPLTMDEKARELAREYGKYLFKNGIFSHTDLEGKGPSERMESAGIEYMFSGENLALASNLDEAHEGLMESQGHRENILYPFFGKVGIGVLDGGDYGMIFVQEFLD
jgi:uncharacterized protein YkwD/uncharacterized membrane protein required for colicin V production